jgi:uncharacterized protein (TIGR03086 family)
MQTGQEVSRLRVHGCGMTISEAPSIPTTSFDPRPLFRVALSTAASVIGGVRPDQMDDPTPCTDDDVRTLLGHLCMVLERVAVLGEGGDALSVLVRADTVADDGWGGAWAWRQERMWSVWTDSALLERPMHLPWADLPGAAMLVMYTNEITLHTWDLAQATDQHPAWDLAVLVLSLETMRRF